MSEDQTNQALTAEQVVEQELKKATGVDVSFKEMDHLTKSRLKMAYKAVSRLMVEITKIETIKNREDRRNPDKVDEIIDGVYSLRNAILYGLCHGVADVVELPKFKTEEEAVAAGMVAQLSELTMLQLAANMRQQDIKLETNKEGSENENTNS